MSRRYSRSSDRASYSGCPWKKTKWLRSSLAKISTPASRRLRQQLIAAGSEVVGAQLVEARMRDLERRGTSSRQPVARSPWRSRRFRSISVSSRCRSMPSRCRTAAWAARHDQIVERVLAFAQSIMSVRSCQNGSSGSVAAFGSAPVTISPSICSRSRSAISVYCRSTRHLRCLRSLHRRQREAVEIDADVCRRLSAAGA